MKAIESRSERALREEVNGTQSNVMHAAKRACPLIPTIEGVRGCEGLHTGSHTSQELRVILRTLHVIVKAIESRRELSLAKVTDRSTDPCELCLKHFDSSYPPIKCSSQKTVLHPSQSVIGDFFKREASCFICVGDKCPECS